MLLNFNYYVYRLKFRHSYEIHVLKKLSIASYLNIHYFAK